MTREEAIAAIGRELATMIYDPRLAERYAALDDALTTLAPAVRYEPPTVEEVGDNEMCWLWDRDRWVLKRGAISRGNWRLMSYSAWLPYSAIPEGGA